MFFQLLDAISKSSLVSLNLFLFPIIYAVNLFTGIAVVTIAVTFYGTLFRLKVCNK